MSSYLQSTFRPQMLSPDEYFNVLKIQNGVDCSKDEVKTVCLPLPCSKDGKIKIRDFLYLDIHRFSKKIIPLFFPNNISVKQLSKPWTETKMDTSPKVS